MDMFWERRELHFIAGTRARIDLDESGQINSKLEEKWIKLGATTQDGKSHWRSYIQLLAYSKN